MDSVAGSLEIIRRYIWNYLLLENEHCQFRAVRDIFITPVDNNISMEMQNMKDEKSSDVNAFSDNLNNVAATDSDESLDNK